MRWKISKLRSKRMTRAVRPSKSCNASRRMKIGQSEFTGDRRASVAPIETRFTSEPVQLCVRIVPMQPYFVHYSKVRFMDIANGRGCNYSPTAALRSATASANSSMNS